MINLFVDDNEIEYAFNEKELLDEMLEYINSTYNAHYSQNQYQSTQIIEDMGHGMGFALGNVIKYCQRYGKKDGFNRDDLKKVIHYGIIALAMHDNEHNINISFDIDPSGGSSLQEDYPKPFEVSLTSDPRDL